MTYLPTSAAAAPQILGLLASAQPIPLNCENGVCQAEFSTVCLQEHRRAPMPGTAYKLSKSSALTLAVAGPDGLKILIDVTGKASIKSLRNFSSVSISLPESMIRKFGAGGAAISVAAMSSLIPVPGPKDTHPHTALEIENTTGALRSVARNIFEADSTNITAMRYLNRVINKMPTGFADDPAQVEKAWRQVNDEKVNLGPPAGQLRTSEIIDECRREYTRGTVTTLKSCIVFQHDSLAFETNKKVWKALKPGG
ncbi:MAG: hypothetical protein CMM10_12725 [Rhodospirillaceae bacterium]|nr:hypothetical protein [Rhodospirillaceae bacterium]